MAFAGPTTFTETLSGPGPTVTAGTTITLRVRITNTGPNPGITNFQLGFDETMQPRPAVAPSGFLCGADPYEWQCTTDAIAAGDSVTVDFPFRIPQSDVGRRLVADLAGDTTGRWSARVVAPAAPAAHPAAPRPPASPGAAPGAAADPAPTLANTGPPVGWEATIAALLCLSGVALHLAARRLPTCR
ncbi:hypothetical protein SAMN04489867_0850 [Pedococcus dokdonensis]|uniref:DUF11 domain-containing protein n=1 Tax=Pedococcus dokdonensis TaxID=443156 RepID=A0A1H0N7E2_9MICO|nr:hypothetical protein [Pedococcus dokdonensis]SDO88405.1 hypothetical protein SAMN04489867_0850 [Pedococcus dokdonensis]